MNISCVICSECFNPASETHITPCGHMFHYDCLIKWLNRSSTCPQCRCKVTVKSIFKVYFNLANTDGIKEDVGTLQSRIENLQFDIKLKEKDLKDRKEKCRNMKAANTKLREEMLQLENQSRVHESAMHALKEQITYFKSKSKDVDRYKEEVFKMKNQMKDFENVQIAVKGTREEVNRMLMNEKDLESLALLAATLKKSLLDVEKRKRDIEHRLKQVQNEASSCRRTMLNLELDNANLKKELEMIKANFAKEKQYLRTKIVETNSDSANSSIKRIMAESPVNYHRRPHLTSSDVICLDDTVGSPPVDEKVKKIVESDSPYLTVKSSGVLDYDSILNRVNYKSTTASATNKHSIFRTASSKSDDLKVPKGAGVGYDGLGGLSKDDVYPTPRPRTPTALKRAKPSGGVPSKKFRRLAPAPNNAKVTDFLDISSGSSHDDVL